MIDLFPEAELTETEQKIVQAIKDGKISTKEISEHLELQYDYVKNVISSILKKTGHKTRTHLALEISEQTK